MSRGEVIISMGFGAVGSFFTCPPRLLDDSYILTESSFCQFDLEGIQREHNSHLKSYSCMHVSFSASYLCLSLDRMEGVANSQIWSPLSP